MSRFAPRWISWSLLAGVVAVGLWLAWRCWFDARLRFLPPAAGAEWIVYPNAPDILARPVAQPGEERPAVFRRTFVMQPTAEATLRVRALESCAVRLNGQPVPAPPAGNWKRAVEWDVVRWLVPGTNRIEVTVTNRAGPPALWLLLQVGGQRWSSDGAWEVSYADAVWRPAHLAKEPRPFRAGNPMHDGGLLAGSVRQKWPQHLTLLIVAILAVWLAMQAERKSWLKPHEMQGAALGGLIAIWLVVCLHNFRQLPPILGFDAAHHLDYIRYIQEHRELPKSGLGWETHQPPLYYLVCANLLGAVGIGAATPEGLMALRLFSLACGLGQILLVFASLRLLFPDELRRPLLGATMAACLPAHLYHTHYVTNEVLFALLISAAFYLALRVLRSRPFHPLLGAGLGACVGAALLTKLTGLIFVPVLLAALLARLLTRRESSLKVWLGELGVPVAAGLLICGSYYGHLLAEGGPWANAGRWGYGTGWWQEDGYRTAEYYFRFGQALLHPLYASFQSFWDGLYSTLWGDGLCGGSASFDSAPPWNYDLLAVGGWLALVPTVAVVGGFFLALKNLVRRPAPEWLLLVGVGLLFGLAAIYFSLIAPGASQVRASFGLMLLVPFCAVFALGLERLTRSRRWLRMMLMGACAWWALNSLVAHWIPTASPQALQLRANSFFRLRYFPQAAALAEAGWRRDSSKSLLRSLLADSWNQIGRTNEARQLVAAALAQWPDDPLAHLDVAFDHVQWGRLDEAVAETRRALELAPDHPQAARLLVTLYIRQRRVDAALAACREALRISPYEPQLRQWMNELREGRLPPVN